MIKEKLTGKSSIRSIRLYPKHYALLRAINKHFVNVKHTNISFSQIIRLGFWNYWNRRMREMNPTLFRKELKRKFPPAEKTPETDGELINTTPKDRQRV